MNQSRIIRKKNQSLFERAFDLGRAHFFEIVQLESCFVRQFL